MAINKRFATEEYVNENYAPISHPHSWADSGEKITYSDTLVWDGNTEGLNAFNNFYFISSAVPTEEDFVNGGTLGCISDGNYEPVEIGGSLVVWADVSEQFGTEAHALVATANGGMLVGILPNGAEMNGEIYEKGVYFSKESDINWTTSLTINGFNGFPTGEIVPLPNKYLPEHLQFGENTTTLVDNQTFTLDEGMTILEGVTIEVNGTYTVVYNGVEYADLQATPVTMNDGVTIYFVGNPAATGGEDNGIPFVIATEPEATVLVDAAQSESCTVTIVGSGIKYLDNKYLKPFETVEIGMDTLEWDGNKDGIENVNDTLYHISNVVPTLEELHNGGNFVVDGNVIEYTSFAEAVSGIIADPDMYVLVVSTEGVTMGDFVFPQTGIYFTSGVTSLTINDYTGFTKEQVKLKEEYLPENTTINSIIFNIDDGPDTVTTDITFDEFLEIWTDGKVNLTNIIEIRINDYSIYESRYSCKAVTFTDNQQFIIELNSTSHEKNIVMDENSIAFA